MSRFTVVLPLAAAALLLAPAAFARDIRETRSFTRADGTKVVAHRNVHTRTHVRTERVTATRADGKVRTVSERISPAASGGFNVSKTVTGFNGQTHTSSGHVGGGRRG